MLKNAKLVGGSGAYFSLPNRPDMKFTQKGFKDKLASDPEFCMAFQELVTQYLSGLIENRKNVSNNTDNVTSGILGMMLPA